MIERAQRYQLGWLAAFLGLSFGAAVIGGTATADSVNIWYRTLRRPDWTPPDWLFGPVWTVLYALMAISAWRVKRAAVERPELKQAANLALGAWLVQIVLNLAWSLVFFGERRIGASLFVIGGLWIAIVAYIGLSVRVSRLAAWLFAPYLAWVSFAAALNYKIWELNK